MLIHSFQQFNVAKVVASMHNIHNGVFVLHRPRYITSGFLENLEKEVTFLWSAPGRHIDCTKISRLSLCMSQYTTFVYALQSFLIRCLISLEQASKHENWIFMAAYHICNFFNMASPIWIRAVGWVVDGEIWSRLRLQRHQDRICHPSPWATLSHQENLSAWVRLGSGELGSPYS